MSTTSDHGLVCLDDQDYAAIALAMQCNSLATDAALDVISDAFDTHYVNPYALAITTATQGPFATSGETLIAPSGFSISSTNMTVSVNTGGFRMTVPRTGFYSHGVYMNLQASGAVTANSRRSVQARATLQKPGVSTILSQFAWRTTDTNTGGEFLVASDGLFFARQNETVDVQGFFSHANAASGVNVNAPARVWCFFLGSGIEIGSA